MLEIDSLLWHKIRCTGEIPAPRYGHSSHLLGSRLFIFGGRGPKGAIYKDTFYLDLESWTWIPISTSSNSPTARFFHASEIVGRKIVIHGGWDGSDTFNDLWIFNTELFSWMQPRTAGFGPSARYGHSLTLSPDGRLFIFGGCSLDKESSVPKYHRDTFILDTETMIWTRPRVNGKHSCRHEIL